MYTDKKRHKIFQIYINHIFKYIWTFTNPIIENQHKYINVGAYLDTKFGALRCSINIIRHINFKINSLLLEMPTSL